MKQLLDRVAVVTGAASGIGRALAVRCVDHGMRVVLADIDASALCDLRDELAVTGARVLAVPTDVSVGPEVERLADATMAEFGAVHLLCNNAGVGLRGLAWERTEQDWEWLLGVNLWGVIHAVRAFVPLMLDEDAGHIVNTASIAGLVPAPFSCVYSTSKSAVVSLSETLALDLAAIGSGIGVSVLCPGFVRSRIVDAARRRPLRLANERDPAERPEEEGLEDRIRAGIAAGTPPEQIADLVVDAVRQQRFWILPHRQYEKRIRERIDHLLAESVT